MDPKPAEPLPDQESSLLVIVKSALVITLCMALLLLTCVYFLQPITEGFTKGDVARLQVKELSRSCETFCRRHGNFPQQLQDLIDPKFSGGAVLKEPRAIVDPWDQPYEMEMQEKGAVIFTFDPTNGRKISSAD